MCDLWYLALGLGSLAVYLAAMAAVLFGAARTLAAPMLWTYLALFTVLCAGATATVHLQSPDLVKERVRPGRASRTESLCASERAHFCAIANIRPPLDPFLPSGGGAESAAEIGRHDLRIFEQFSAGPSQR